MSDLIKRGQALKCAEHDTETYYALSCLPGVDAIPIKYIDDTLKQWKRDGYSESAEALEILMSNWKTERKEE